MTKRPTEPARRISLEKPAPAPRRGRTARSRRRARPSRALDRAPAAARPQAPLGRGPGARSAASAGARQLGPRLSVGGARGALVRVRAPPARHHGAGRLVSQHRHRHRRGARRTRRAPVDLRQVRRHATRGAVGPALVRARGIERSARRRPSPDGRIRVRYLPHGEGLESFHQWAASPSLLYAPPAVTPAWRFRWRAAGETAPGLRPPLVGQRNGAPREPHGVEQRDLSRQRARRPRPAGRSPDRRLDSRRGATRPRCRCASDPADPHRIFVADALSGLPPSGGNGFAELFFSLVLVLPFGLPFWWVGTRLLSRGVAPRHRHYFVWVPLALLPFWGVRYLEVLERLSPGALENNALLGKVGSSQVLPGAEPAGPGPSFDRRQRIDLAGSRFAPTLALVDLSRPAPAARKRRRGLAGARGALHCGALAARRRGLRRASSSRRWSPSFRWASRRSRRCSRRPPAWRRSIRRAAKPPGTAARQLLNFLTYTDERRPLPPEFRRLPRGSRATRLSTPSPRSPDRPASA